MTAAGREKLLIGVIIVAGVLLRPPGPSFAPDDAAALVTADQVWYGLRPYEAAPCPRPVVSLGAFLLLAQLPRSVWTMQAVNLLLSLLIELAVLLAARRLWGRRGGVAAMATATALLLTPWAGSVSVVLPVALVAMGAALAITAQTAERETCTCLVGAGLLLGLAVGASVDVTAGAAALVFGAWLWIRALPRVAMPGAFILAVAGTAAAGWVVGGEAYFTCLRRGLDYYLGDVTGRYASEALLHSIELYLAQPAPLIALGVAGVLALRQAPGQARAMAPTLAAWLVGAVLDANWGRRYEAGAWMPLLPVLAMGAGAFVGVGKRSPEPDRGKPLVLAVVLLALVLLVPRAKVAMGHYRDLFSPTPVVSADDAVAESILRAAGPGGSMFVWAGTQAAAAHCRARLVPPDPYMPYRLAGFWRTAEKTERRETHEWPEFGQLLKSAQPQWIVLQTDGDFEELFPWWSYELLAAIVEQNYALFIEVPGRTVYRLKIIDSVSPAR